MESLRVNFKERQRLQAADLQSEQEYFSGLDQRHNLDQHSPGIVRGLSLRVENDERAVVEPGLAIDSQGRDVVLRDEVSFDIEDADSCVDVWLIHCLQPHRLSQPGRSSCSAETFQRWAESPRILAVSTETDDDPDAPVNGAIFLGRIVCNDAQDVEYTAIRGGEVADPGGRAEMQVGPRTGWDPQEFVVNVADANGKQTPRIAIDRRGRNILTGTLDLLEYRASLLISLFNQTARLLIKAKEPGQAGEDILVDVSEKTSNEPAVVTLTFLNSSKVSSLPPSEKIEISNEAEKWEEIIKDFNKSSRLVSLVITEVEKEKQRISAQAPSRDDRPPALSLGGGMLLLDGWPEQEESNPKEFRGCYEPATRSNPGVGNKPNGLSFRPVEEPPEGAPTPRIYSVFVEEGEFKKEQLRVDMGEKKDGDETVRFSLGEWSGENESVIPWLSINGSCAMSAPDRDEEAGQLIVTGSIEQSPILADPNDPDFRDLLLKSWIDGLQTAVRPSLTIALAFEELPDVIETQKVLTYDVRVRNNGPTEAQVDNALETTKLTGSPGVPNFLDAGFTIPANGNDKIPVRHEKGEFSAGELSVQVKATGTINKTPWFQVHIKEKIAVVETPQVIFEDIPDEVPPSTPWTHHFTVKNADARRTLRLISVMYQEDATEPDNMLPDPVDLLALHSTEQFSVPHPGGITVETPVTVFLEYEWASGPEGTLIEHRIIRVAVPLEVTFETPEFIEESATWNFSLTLKNLSSAMLTGVQLNQRLLGPGGLIGEQTIPSNTQIDLQPGESHEFDDLEGISAGPGTNPVHIELDVEYEREGREWEQTYESGDIEVRAPEPPKP
jgi:hypothetical protein